MDILWQSLECLLLLAITILDNTASVAGSRNTVFLTHGDFINYFTGLLLFLFIYKSGPISTKCLLNDLHIFLSAIDSPSVFISLMFDDLLYISSIASFKIDHAFLMSVL